MGHYREIKAKGVELFAVSVDPPETSETLRQSLDVQFTFLSDPKGELLDLLNIRHRGARRDGGDIAHPAQVLIDKNGIVRWTYRSEFYRVRASPEEVFAAIETLTR